MTQSSLRPFPKTSGASMVVTDADDLAAEKISDLLEKGFARAFDSLQELRRHLRNKPVVSDLIVVTKISAGGVKKRIIIDLRRSGVSRSSFKSERVMLPRALDLVWDVLDLLADADADEVEGEPTHIILDFMDAFFQVPIRPKERRFAVLRHRGR